MGEVNEVTAQMVEGLLNENNIECRLENIDPYSIPLTGPFLPQVRIWVTKEDADKAKEILDEVEDYGYCAECGAIALPKETKCARCDSPLEESE